MITFYIKLYLLTIPVFFGIDMIWLGVISKNFYKNQLGYLMSSNVNWSAAIIFYLLFIVGLIYFVVSPALAQSSWQKAALAGALFGLISYATYDLTNLATVKDWPLLVTVVDLAWGAALAALVSTVSYFIGQAIK